MIRRDALKSVKFDERFSNGEDMLFIYQILTTGADVVFLPHSWYYYRRYEGCVSKRYSVETIQSKYRVWQYIRNQEMENSRSVNTMQCERIILGWIVVWYTDGRHRRDESIKKYVKSLVDSERSSTLFSKIDRYTRLRVCSVVYCYPLYWIQHIFFQRLFAWGMRLKQKRMEKEWKMNHK